MVKRSLPQTPLAVQADAPSSKARFRSRLALLWFMVLSLAWSTGGWAPPLPTVQRGAQEASQAVVIPHFAQVPRAGVAWPDLLPASLMGQPLWRVAQALMARITPECSLILAQAPPPAPALVPPNASNITATVRRYTAIAPIAPPSAGPAAPHDQPLASLVLEIQTSEPVNPQMGSLTRPDTTIETFSAEALASDLVGKQIAATVTLTGDTQRMRWIISNIRVLP